MSATDTKALIAKSLERFLSEVPALGNLILTNLRARAVTLPVRTPCLLPLIFT